MELDETEKNPTILLEQQEEEMQEADKGYDSGKGEYLEHTSDTAPIGQGKVNTEINVVSPKAATLMQARKKLEHSAWVEGGLHIRRIWVFLTLALPLNW